MELMELSMRLRALAVFRGLLSEPVIESLCSYLDCMENAWPQGMISGYAELVSRLYQTDEGDLGRHILRVVMEQENIYIRAVGRGRRRRTIWPAAWPWSWKPCRRRRP